MLERFSSSFLSIPPQAAVAVIEWVDPNSQETAFFLMQRSKHPLDPWSGHLAFPGGKIEDQDTTSLDTCIRETQEEVGISLSKQDLYRELSPSQAGNHLKKSLSVIPYWFKLSHKPRVTPDPTEVQQTFWVETKDLINPQFQGHQNGSPGIHLNNLFLWGFTYNVLKSVLSLKNHDQP